MFRRTLDDSEGEAQMPDSDDEAVCAHGAMAPLAKALDRAVKRSRLGSPDRHASASHSSGSESAANAGGSISPKGNLSTADFQVLKALGYCQIWSFPQKSMLDGIVQKRNIDMQTFMPRVMAKIQDHRLEQAVDYVEAFTDDMDYVQVMWFESIQHVINTQLSF